MELGLRGKRALVMGASKGLGRAIAEALAADGASLAISGRDAERLAPVCEALKAKGAAAAHAFAADVGRGEDMDALAKGAVAALGGIDILVLNHGGPPAGTATDVTEEALETWFRRIVLSPIRLANLLLPAMRAQKHGRIIAVGSTGMVQPLPNLALSNILRANIVGWAKTLADEVGPDGVTVNIVAPGAIMTDRSVELAGAAASKSNSTPEKVIADREKTIPMRRYGTPEEFGRAAAFLASDGGSYVTGTILRVDGGVVRGF
ncbi:SDR family oxidoreductase [Muricoccus aerilatus]|uniref:SDR family oxidoreductase n=1 Tax=Muricoccus aerilatus TaxID=452982 RepID=UPI0005C260BA|nr:SDR family oxidoreductase [Roseomonas aerilata]